MGGAYVELGSNTKAIQYLQQGLQIAEELKDRKLKRVALGNLGFAYSAIRESLRPGLPDQDKVTILDTQANTYKVLQKVLSKWVEKN